RRLDRRFAISEAVRRDVIAIANVAPSRIVTIHGGLDDERGPAPDPAAPQEAQFPFRFRNGPGAEFVLSEPYWLYVGGDDFRKNLPRLIEALGILKADGRL